jgi:hypothetical protein
MKYNVELFFLGKCTFQRYTDDSHLPKGRFVLVGRFHSFPLVGCSPTRPSPIPCNVSGVSRGRIPITVSSTCLHRGELNRTTFLWSDCSQSVFDSAGESLYASDPTRLTSSSGHGGDWRTGVDFQHTGSFTHSVKHLSCPWGREPWGTRRGCERDQGGRDFKRARMVTPR